MDVACVAVALCLNCPGLRAASFLIKACSPSATGHFIFTSSQCMQDTFLEIFFVFFFSFDALCCLPAYYFTARHGSGRISPSPSTRPSEAARWSRTSYRGSPPIAHLSCACLHQRAWHSQWSGEGTAGSTQRRLRSPQWKALENLKLYLWNLMGHKGCVSFHIVFRYPWACWTPSLHPSLQEKKHQLLQIRWSLKYITLSLWPSALYLYILTVETDNPNSLKPPAEMHC